MSEVANLYDNGPISPICKIDQNLAIYTQKKWQYFKATFIEGFPRSTPLVVDMVAAGTTLAANGTIAKALVAFLQLQTLELLHLRWEPLDDVEGVLWEQPGVARFAVNGGQTQARVTRFTSLRDPYLAMSTFWVIGNQRDMNLEVRNPNAYALPQARFVFWGYRYVLEQLTGPNPPEIYTRIPAEGQV